MLTPLILTILTYHIDMYDRVCEYYGNDETVCECIIHKLDEDERELEDIPNKELRRWHWQCKANEI